jgi:acyl carrier protein
MQRDVVRKQLTKYIAQDVLEGKDIDLDETTPLLEWGIINSLEMVKLLSFIREQFGVDIPTDKLVADSFTSILQFLSMEINCSGSEDICSS